MACHCEVHNKPRPQTSESSDEYDCPEQYIPRVNYKYETPQMNMPIQSAYDPSRTYRMAAPPPENDICCPCNCRFNERRFKGADALRRANDLIDYQPQSEFLRKMKQQSQFMANNQPNMFPSVNENCPRGYRPVEGYTAQPRLLRQPLFNDEESYRDTPNDAYNSNDEEQIKSKKHPKTPPKKSQHISRSKKPKCRGRRKRKSGSEEKCESEHFEPTLKRPHENSCERCWRYASPARSPVNKPDQKFDPNFRRGHSCYDFEIGDGGEIDRHISPCKNLQPITSREKQEEKEQPPETYSGGTLKQAPSSRQRSAEGQRSQVVQQQPQEQRTYHPPVPRMMDEYDSRHAAKETHYRTPSEGRYPASSQRTPYVESLHGPRPMTPDTVASTPRGLNRCSFEIDELDGTEYPVLSSQPLERTFVIPTPKSNWAVRLYSKEPQPMAETFYYTRTPTPPQSELRGPLEILDPQFNRIQEADEESRKCAKLQTSKSPTRPGSPKKSSLKSGEAATGTSPSKRPKSPKSSGASPRKSPKSPSGAARACSPSKSSKSPSRPATAGPSSRSPTSPGRPVTAGPSSRSPTSPGRPVTAGPSSRSPTSPGRPVTAGAPSKSPGRTAAKSAQGRTKSLSPRRDFGTPEVVDLSQRCPNLPGAGARNVNASEVLRTPQRGTPNQRPQTAGAQPGSFVRDSYTFSRVEPPLVQYSGMDHPVRECPCDPEASLLRGASNQQKRVVCCHCDWQQTNKSGEGRKPPPQIVPASPRQVIREGRTYECPHRTKINEVFEKAFENAGNSSFNRDCRMVNQSQRPPMDAQRHPMAATYDEALPIQGSCTPRKYMTFYMTKCTQSKDDDDVEVLVEELMQSYQRTNDNRTKNIAEKMKKIMENPSDSLALRFQKGVSEQCKDPPNSRILYF